MSTQKQSTIRELSDSLVFRFDAFTAIAQIQFLIRELRFPQAMGHGQKAKKDNQQLENSL